MLLEAGFSDANHFEDLSTPLEKALGALVKEKVHPEQLYFEAPHPSTVRYRFLHFGQVSAISSAVLYHARSRISSLCFSLIGINNAT